MKYQLAGKRKPGHPLKKFQDVIHRPERAMWPKSSKVLG